MADFEQNGTLLNSDPWFSVPVSILKETCLTAYDKLVYIDLLSYAGREATAWPRIRKIAEETGASERTVIRSLQNLENLFLIEKQARFESTPGGSARQTSNLYKIFTPKEAAEKRKMTGVTQSPVPSSHGGSAPQSPGGVSHSNRGGVTQSPHELDLKELDHLEPDLKESINPVLKPVENTAPSSACQPPNVKYAGLVGERPPTGKTETGKPDENRVEVLLDFFNLHIPNHGKPDTARGFLREFVAQYSDEHIKAKIRDMSKISGIADPCRYLKSMLTKPNKPMGAVPHTPSVKQMETNGLRSGNSMTQPDGKYEQYSEFYKLFPTEIGHEGAYTQNSHIDRSLEIPEGALGWL